MSNQAVLREFAADASAMRECACGGSSGGCAECSAKKRNVGRVERGGSRHTGVPASVYDVIGSRGDRIDRSTRSFMESRFGYDFNGVEIHTDSRAAKSAREVHALAYTVGNHVVFGASQYRPDTAGGRTLLAHELTHTIQQGAANPGASLQLSDPGDSYEADARETAAKVLRNETDQSSSTRYEGSLQRQEEESSSGATPDSAEDDQTSPADARKALADVIGEDRLRDLEQRGTSPQDQEANAVATQVMSGSGMPQVERMVGNPELMTAGPAAIAGAILAAGAICATGWFFYTEGKYGSKNDKWKHCYCGCKIATYCGGPVFSTLIGAGKEVADAVMDLVGIPANAEWEDFVADEEGAWSCAVGQFLTSCHSCCSSKRP